jgi:hypothetical protein
MVEPQALGWKVECTAKPMEHQVGPCTSREKAVRIWNEKQREVLRDAGSGEDRAAPA